MASISDSYIIVNRKELDLVRGTMQNEVSAFLSKYAIITGEIRRLSCRHTDKKYIIVGMEEPCATSVSHAIHNYETPKKIGVLKRVGRAVLTSKYVHLLIGFFILTTIVSYLWT